MMDEQITLFDEAPEKNTAEAFCSLQGEDNARF